MIGTRAPESDDDRVRRRWLRTAALAPPGPALAAWRAWRDSRPSASVPLVDPASGRWLPLVWANLRDTPIDSGDREMLREEYRRAWLTNQRTIDVATSVIETFHDAGIRTLLLKGVALASTTYERSGLRPIGDADVLVDPACAPAAREMLARSGWTPIRDVDPASLDYRASLGYAGPSGVDIDLHWYALGDCLARDADRGFWSRAVPVPLGRTTTHVLSDADQLLHVCAHGLRPAPVPSAHWMADAVTILRRAGDDMDWASLIEEARARNLTTQLRRALGMLASEQFLQLPPSAIEALEAVSPAWWERVEDRAKQTGWPPPLWSLVVQLGCRRARRRVLETPAARRPSFTSELAMMSGTSGLGAFARQSADRLLGSSHGESHSFVAYGRVIRMSADRGVTLRHVLDGVEQRLPRFDRPRRPGEPDRAYRVVPMEWSRPPEPTFRVLVNNRALAAEATLDDLAAQIVNDLQTYLALTLPDRTWVHAGVVDLRGCIIVLPGASSAGKSTLVSALVDAGGAYLSDEFAILDAAGRVWPYARPLRLRDEAGTRVPAHRIAGDVGTPVGKLVFTSYRPGGAFEPRPLSRGEALMRLLKHCPGAEARPVETLAALRALVDAAPAWESERGEAGVTAAALVAAVARDPAAACRSAV